MDNLESVAANIEMNRTVKQAHLRGRMAEAADSYDQSINIKIERSWERKDAITGLPFTVYQEPKGTPNFTNMYKNVGTLAPVLGKADIHPEIKELTKALFLRPPPAGESFVFEEKAPDAVFPVDTSQGGTWGDYRITIARQPRSASGSVSSATLTQALAKIEAAVIT
ncbi:MAG: hypothetical protein P4L87_24255 [Formivibrio sp.]|nr:hypothetical protein [Formivibrio sp.]